MTVGKEKHSQSGILWCSATCTGKILFQNMIGCTCYPNISVFLYVLWVESKDQGSYLPCIAGSVSGGIILPSGIWPESKRLYVPCKQPLLYIILLSICRHFELAVHHNCCSCQYLFNLLSYLTFLFLSADLQWCGWSHPESRAIPGGEWIIRRGKETRNSILFLSFYIRN